MVLITYIEQLNDLRGEIRDIECRLQKLRKNSKKMVKDVVRTSSLEFPYIQTTTTIEGRGEDLDRTILRKVAFLEKKKAELMELEQKVTESIYKSELSSKERRVLTLYYIDRMTWQQVAMRIGETDEQVPRRIRNRIFARMEENNI